MGLKDPKGGPTKETTQTTQVPQYASAAQQNLLNFGTQALTPNIYTPQYTTAPINADMSAGYDLARQLAQSAFSSMGTPATGPTTQINPGLKIDVDAYMRNNPDLVAAGVDPLEHYKAFGAKEGRQVPMSNGQMFDRQAYLAANPDVAASGMDPLMHYMTFGAAEGRSVGSYQGTTTIPGTEAKPAERPVPTVTMKSLEDIARPTFADPRADPKSMAPTTANTYQAATYDPTSYTANTVTGADIQALLNPYTQSVVDTTNATARRNMEETLASNRAQQAAAGAYGGSRGAVSDAILQRGFQDNVASTTASLMAAGWDKASATALANSNSINAAGQFNANAANTAGQFNAGAKNTAGQFNANAQNTRDTFNAEQNSQLLDAWNKLLQQDYTNQYTARQGDNTNSITAATTNEALRTGDFNRQQQALATLLGVGNSQREIYQQSLDSPLKMLSALAGITPQQYSTTQTGVAPNTAASPLQNLIGLGGSLLTAPLTGGGSLLGNAATGIAGMFR